MINRQYKLFCLIATIILILGFLITEDVLFVQAQETELSREEILQKSRQYYSEGEKFYNQHDYSRADEEFKKAQDLLDLLEQKQEEHTLIKDKDREVEILNYDGYLKRALEFSKDGESEKAITYFLKAIYFSPDNANLHYNLAVEYLKTKQFNPAAEELNKVIQLNPKDKDAYYNLGVLYESYFRDLQRAKFYYTRYIKLAGREVDVEIVKAWVRQIDDEIKRKREIGF